MNVAIAANAIVTRLRAQANPGNVAGQRRFGIRPNTEQLGLSMVILRQVARENRRRHDLALALWEHRIHEARLLACLIADSRQLTAAQMNGWAREFDSWDLCDQACIKLFRRHPRAFACAKTWSARRSEFVKRAGFVLMATLAVHAKDEPDATFANFLPVIVAAANDDRNFVRKGVNWALRQIGKRNLALRGAAIATAKLLAEREDVSARWIGRDAVRELTRARTIRPAVTR